MRSFLEIEPLVSSSPRQSSLHHQSCLLLLLRLRSFRFRPQNRLRPIHDDLGLLRDDVSCLQKQSSYRWKSRASSRRKMEEGEARSRGCAENGLLVLGADADAGDQRYGDVRSTCGADESHKHNFLEKNRNVSETLTLLPFRHSRQRCSRPTSTCPNSRPRT